MPAGSSIQPEKRCRVLGCSNVLLLGGPCGAYCRKRRICHMHLQAAAIEQAGQSYRFCHQCGRLQPLRDFDGTRRSCVVSLSKRRHQDAYAHGRTQAAAQPGCPATPTHSKQQAAAGAAGGDANRMATADEDQDQEQHWQLQADAPALPWVGGADAAAAASPAPAAAAAAWTAVAAAGLPRHCWSGGVAQVAATPLALPPPTADNGGCDQDDELADRLLQELLRDVQWDPAAAAPFAACSPGSSSSCMHGAATPAPVWSSGEQELEQLATMLEQELLAAAMAARSDCSDDTNARRDNNNSGRSGCCFLAGLAGPATAPAAASHLPAPGPFSAGVGGQDASCGLVTQQMAWRQRHQELLWQHQQLSALLQQVSATASMLQLLL